ncbi:MAG TPA: hypothetical protein VLB67_01235 [Acidimicrobiia bacterium]|nr:hypothetical protein [Acidimicrobiia bacterium]
MRRVLALVGVMVLVGCGADTEPVPTVEDDRPASPEEVFSLLSVALDESDFSSAAQLSDSSQFPILAIAEGKGPREAAALTSADLRAVGANFWSGFATQLRSAVDAGLADLAAGPATRSVAGNSEFATIELTLPREASVRTIVLRDTTEGWVVDLIASFPSPLLGLVPNAAQVIRSSGDVGLREALTGYEDSVNFVLERSGVDEPMLNQAALAALEAIVR